VTCAELQAVGVPALLVPLKIGNGEQSANAQELLESGQALKVENSEFTSKWLQENIAKILEHAPKRTNGQARHAAARIGESVLRIIRVNQ
jgi:UDP-N-acetylglucosamine--N-acetylmuramyl-(pentapeptide) pyrophosphoryl-undecaprenol N-acetylglucosamine transferase